MPIDASGRETTPTEFEVLTEVWLITERRDGAVYKTKFLEKRWVPMGDRSNPTNPDEIYAALSTNDPDNGTLPRRRKG